MFISDVKSAFFNMEVNGILILPLEDEGGPLLFITSTGEVAGIPRENPCMHRERLQTPCRNTSGWESNPGLSVLPTAPLVEPVEELAV